MTGKRLNSAKHIKLPKVFDAPWKASEQKNLKELGKESKFWRPSSYVFLDKGKSSLLTWSYTGSL